MVCLRHINKYLLSISFLMLPNENFIPLYLKLIIQPHMTMLNTRVSEVI